MHNREDVDEQSDTVDEGEGTEARLEGLLLLEDEGVEEHVQGTRHDAGEHGGDEPRGHCWDKAQWLELCVGNILVTSTEN